ncbi:unnamed protein product [Phytophthora lilii]|uniref:Unnamed protein product n=1 Tax=Phytophthora lilii TaxID=2077276 RepID=A0A9W6TG82_9STRA|nr:unnamed protein product [Phytophthora lilii]
MKTVSKNSMSLLLLVAAASSSVSVAANLRQVQRSLGASYSQSSDFLSAMLARVNKERAAEGLPPVCANKKLQSSSQRHSDDMAANNYMAHDGTDGSTMSTRITDTGYDWSAVGENVAAGQEDVDSVMDAWMHSPEHRENIMGEYTMLGVAYGFNENTEYKHYWTQDFGKGDHEACDSSTSTGSDNQDQVAQNQDQVQGDADSDETPVPKTSVHVTEAPEPEAKTPCPKTEADRESTPVPKTDVHVTESPKAETPCPEAPVQEATPATEAPETPAPEAQQTVPGKVSPAKDCDPKF